MKNTIRIAPNGDCLMVSNINDGTNRLFFEIDTDKSIAVIVSNGLSSTTFYSNNFEVSPFMVNVNASLSVSLNNSIIATVLCKDFTLDKNLIISQESIKSYVSVIRDFNRLQGLLDDKANKNHNHAASEIVGTVADADTVDGKHASDFLPKTGGHISGFVSASQAIQSDNIIGGSEIWSPRDGFWRIGKGAGIGGDKFGFYNTQNGLAATIETGGAIWTRGIIDTPALVTPRIECSSYFDITNGNNGRDFDGRIMATNVNEFAFGTQYAGWVGCHNASGYNVFAPYGAGHTDPARYQLGSSGNPWRGGFTTAALYVTSDREKKRDIEYELSKYEALFYSLKPVRYKLKGGENEGYHLGLIAQDIEDFINDENVNVDNLTLNELALLNKQLKTDEDMNEIEDEYDYSLTYEELISLNIHMIQKLAKENDELKSKNDELEERVTRLEGVTYGTI